MKTGTVKVKCPQCKATRDIAPGEISESDYPMCDKCCLPMLPVSASTKGSRH